MVCATDAGPVIVMIDRYVGAGFDTIYLHQVGSDQARLLEMATTELLPHHQPATSSVDDADRRPTAQPAPVAERRRGVDVELRARGRAGR